MQTQTQIRHLLAEAGLAPHRALGQNFLVDLNLLGKLLDLAQIGAGQTVLEVGPGTGSLTEELLARAGRVVAVEIDRGLHGLLAGRLAGRENLTLLHGDALAGKHALSPEVLAALGGPASLVSNLPYSIATPLVIDCLIASWRAIGRLCRFERLTFTVQREVADRMTAAPGEEPYGPLRVWVALLGRVRVGPRVPAEAFWPRPAVTSRMLRIDFDAAAAARLADADTLSAVLAAAFGQRRKQIGSLLRRRDCPFPPDRLAVALAAAGVETTVRPQRVAPEQFLALANALARR